MKKLFTVLAIALFTISVNAQETKPAAKTPVKKEACCAKKCTADKKTKCTAEAKAKCEKTSKSCCSKKA
ncbi:hypothetical protein [Flavobacterium sp.]|uniref:hypothetical protein n=1 Tax=Flavobacterium sp. TaxID=239 RepID=UPI0037BE862C